MSEPVVVNTVEEVTAAVVDSCNSLDCSTRVHPVSVGYIKPDEFSKCEIQKITTASAEAKKLYHKKMDEHAALTQSFVDKHKGYHERIQQLESELERLRSEVRSCMKEMDRCENEFFVLDNHSIRCQIESDYWIWLRFMESFNGNPNGLSKQMMSLFDVISKRHGKEYPTKGALTDPNGEDRYVLLELCSSKFSEKCPRRTRMSLELETPNDEGFRPLIFTLYVVEKQDCNFSLRLDFSTRSAMQQTLSNFAMYVNGVSFTLDKLYGEETRVDDTNLGKMMRILDEIRVDPSGFLASFLFFTIIGPTAALRTQTNFDQLSSMNNNQFLDFVTLIKNEAAVCVNCCISDETIFYAKGRRDCALLLPFIQMTMNSKLTFPNVVGNSELNYALAMKTQWGKQLPLSTESSSTSCRTCFEVPKKNGHCFGFFSSNVSYPDPASPEPSESAKKQMTNNCLGAMMTAKSLLDARGFTTVISSKNTISPPSPDTLPSAQIPKYSLVTVGSDIIPSVVDAIKQQQQQKQQHQQQRVEENYDTEKEMEEDVDLATTDTSLTENRTDPPTDATNRIRIRIPTRSTTSSASMVKYVPKNLAGNVEADAIARAKKDVGNTCTARLQYYILDGHDLQKYVSLYSKVYGYAELRGFISKRICDYCANRDRSQGECHFTAGLTDEEWFEKRQDLMKKLDIAVGNCMEVYGTQNPTSLPPHKRSRSVETENTVSQKRRKLY